MSKHNHITRSIKPEGECPGCDQYYINSLRIRLIELEAQLTYERDAKEAFKAGVDRYTKALELALYYVEGDATYEAVKEKCYKILEGK